MHGHARHLARQCQVCAVDAAHQGALQQQHRQGQVDDGVFHLARDAHSAEGG